MNNIFDKAKRFEANQDLLKDILQFKYNQNNNNNLALIKHFITDTVVGIIPVEVEGDFVNYKMTRRDKEVAYINSTSVHKGGNLKILDFYAPDCQYIVLYTDYKTVQKSTNPMFEKSSWVTITGIELLYLAHTDDIWGTIINPFTPSSIALRNYYFKDLNGLPKFIYDTP